MAKVTPFLWYDTQAEEAMNLYTSIFKNSKAGRVTHSPAAPPGSNGVFSVTFEIEGQHFIALNGGPAHKFTPAISLFVDCETQEEVDDLWAKLCPAASPAPAAGSAISLASPGRSSQKVLARCSPIPTRSAPNAC